MRIVHLVIGGEVAGGQLVALSLADAARDHGHDVSFVSPTGGAFVGRAEAAGFRVRIVPLGGALDARSLIRLRRALRKERADILHTHAHFSVNVLGRMAARLAGAAVVGHAHIENVFRSGRAARRAQLAVDNATARLCARILAVSEATRESLVGQGYPAGRVEVVPNGIDVTEATPRRPEGVPAGAQVLLLVGRLAAVKGQRELIGALPSLPEAVAVLVGLELEGDATFVSGLKQEAARLGVADRVLLTGYRADVPELLAGADIFVLPSYAEGLPVTILEAMAQARPVVATSVGGTPELVVDGETGVLVPPGDVDALSRALAHLLADPDRRRALGEAGRRRVLERFSARAAAERVLAVYAEVRPTMTP